MFSIKKMPKVLPDYMGFGDETEAIQYVNESMEVWGPDKMAVRWLAGLFHKIENELMKLCEQREKEKRDWYKELSGKMPS